MNQNLMWRVVALIVVVGALAFGYQYFIGDGQALSTGDSSKKSKGSAAAAPVRVAKVETRSVPIRLEAIGAVQSRSTVQVRSRVDGQLIAAEFREGQWVKKGDLLFRIDPRSFESQLRQAQANLARDQAQLDKARSDLDRYAQLSQKGFSSQQKYEEAKASVSALQAIIRADQAAVEMAKLQLEFTEIRAPIHGRTGNILITPGNLIKANDMPALVVINETRPIYVAFSVPEGNVFDLKARMAKGPMSVTVALPERLDQRMTGEVTFINNAVDTATGTIQLKATFANDDEFLTPGQFVRVAVNLDTLTDALVVPTGAIQDGQKGSYVFVMRPDMTVEPRNVIVGPAADNRTVIRTGLAVGETVVTDGQLRLFPGARVQPQKPGVADGTPGKVDAGKGHAGKQESKSKEAAKHNSGKDSGKPEARQ